MNPCNAGEQHGPVKILTDHKNSNRFISECKYLILKATDTYFTGINALGTNRGDGGRLGDT
jgi:hypothetical protein